ncbi:hypothetical protein BO70DRAFT_379289 [Aspergillus heteromorphus CBS 117.55]|uniref:Uncharacterized protein n=1 Tax=Aspergillus heteromorphus CBS 117.55 TaxID=1448321 RepID=A0A317WH17_9EURO|nr:uncharacterized protein BO70DRAFT_379289 [Aspergillus heteromorphus CBS 117.55]PWY83490.1 hypothetical protein BO70DRAFT_379289 [Aspergillus heteromorphus CBS 117.55]
MPNTDNNSDENNHSARSTFTMPDSHMSGTSDPHIPEQDNFEDLDMSELEQLTNLTEQVESAFCITEDSSFTLLSAPGNNENRAPSQQAGRENGGTSLDPSQHSQHNHSLPPHSYHLDIPKIPDLPSPPYTSESLDLVSRVPAGPELVGILKKSRDKRESKKVKFASSPPGKVVKRYRSGQVMADSGNV